MSNSVLIIDDDMPFRKALCLSLENAGFVCQEAENGRKGLDLLEEGLSVNVIIVDFDMPILNGLNFLRALSDRIMLKSMRVIMLSGNMTKKMERQALEAGAFHVLTKPCDHQEFLAVVSRACHEEDS